MSASTPKVVVITGATKGLGRAMAEGMAQQGCVVAGCGRSEADIAQLRESLGPSHAFDVLDVANDADVKAWADAFLARFGPPDLLINNAATINPNARLWDISAEVFDRVIDVNLKGMANVIRHVVPAMVARASGVIVNVSSYWGRSTSREVAPYCCTKWGVEGLTRALAQDLPKGMAAIPLNPGIVDTAMLRSCFGEKSSDYLTPDEWAKAAVPYLLKLGPSDNGRPLTVPGQ
jgi:NAD(P)-dependent dehydrogenase (short-subunit alcohol dehydrogenase family)